MGGGSGTREAGVGGGGKVGGGGRRPASVSSPLTGCGSSASGARRERLRLAWGAGPS